MASNKVQEELANSRADAVLSEQLSTPAAINSVEIHGAKNTRRSFLSPLVGPLVDGGRNQHTTIGDVLARIQVATETLQRFDIFKTKPTVHISQACGRDPQAAAHDLDIAIRVAEQSRLVFKAGTEVGNAEGSANASLLFRNLFGGAESLSVNAVKGTRTRAAYNAVLATPVASNPDCRLSCEGLASTTVKPWASHEEVLTGGTMRLAWLTQTRDAVTLAYQAVWRQVTGLAAGASPTVRASAGDTAKSSVACTIVRDRRDNPVLPQRGHLLRVAFELAGWGPLAGDVSFAKSELELAGAAPVPLPGFSGRTGIVLTGGMRFGLLCPLPFGYSTQGHVSLSHISDRFQLGGPTDVRGFKIGGLGPHDGTDAVGGDVFAAGGMGLLVPLTRSGAASPLRLHVFANGGRLLALSWKPDSKHGGLPATTMRPERVWAAVKKTLGEMTDGLPSLAAGVGLVYAHPAARFEINFSLPLVERGDEQGRKGVQVGVGISFL